MSARYRVALHGFSEFERTTLTFCFRHAATREPGYQQVALIADSDFIVADASHEGIAGSQIRGERLRDTLFIGDKPPHGATACLRRPIDPERILRALDQMANPRGSRVHEERPDIVLPLDAAETRRPLPDPRATEDTAPAAFQHEPVSITFTDLEAFNAVDTEPGGLPADAAGGNPAVWSPSSTPASSGRPAPAPRPAPAVAKAPRAPRLSAAERAEAKAAARRASRQLRLMQAANAAVDSPHDVLLLDAAAGPVALGVLLEAFGFVVHHAHSMAQAAAVLARTPLAAAFLDMATSDPDSIDCLEMCQLIKQRELPLAGAVPAVMLTASRDSAADRVRAKLAGCDAFLAGTVTRGDAARALESCNVALPADARRA